MEANKISRWLNVLNKISNNDSEEFRDIRKSCFDLQIKARENLDKWIFSIITLSSAILGFSASSLIGNDVVLNKYFLYLGLALFFANVITGITILKKRLKAISTAWRKNLVS